MRDESEWIKVLVPDLRIIDDRLWARVKAQQQEIMESSAAIREALHANARTGRGPKYLFSGLLVCAECHGKFVVVDAKRYGVSSHPIIPRCGH